MSALRNIFTDLMAYVLFFEATCAQRPPSASEVREKVKALLDVQERRVKAGEVPWEPYREARFAVLSWVDELILNSDWPNRGQWQHLMLEFYGTLNAGEELFQRLEGLPPGTKEIQEIYYFCLALGFRGEYALTTHLHQLKELRSALFRQLPAAPDDLRQGGSRLFPEAYLPAPEGKRSALPRIRPFWFALALLLPPLLFFSYSFILRDAAIRLLARIGGG